MRSGTLSKSFAVILLACAAATAAEPVRIIYVDAAAGGAKTGASWADACNHLQDALALAAAAEKPVEIHVAKGVYRPDQGVGITPGDRLATFQLLTGVALKGGYAGVAGPNPDARDIKLYETILSGDLAGNDGATNFTRDPGAADFPKKENTCNVVTGSGTDNTAVIDGFTITAGSMSPIRPYGSQPLVGGAGMLIDAGSPIVRNCCFVDNYTTSKEVLLARNGSNPVLTNCTFLNNQGTAMDNSDNSNAILTNCRFEGNMGGAMEIQHSSPVITDCQFIGNWSDTIDAQDCNSVLTDCVFEGDGHGVDCHGGHLTLTNCTFTGFDREAISTSGDLTLVRCAFRDNSGFRAGAVGGAPNRRITALECTFAGNDGHIAGAISAGDMELHDCEFTGNSGSYVGAIDNGFDRFIATGCIFSGNSSRFGAGAIRSHPELFKMSNCTFVGNRGQYGSLDCLTFGPVPMQLTQCILRDGPQPLESRFPGATRISVTYSNVRGGFPGEGNIDVDPCFVDPGYWADASDLTKEAGPEDPCAVWVAGDYHLKSQAGHWDRASESWVRDDVTSRCIDAGNPINPLGTEPFPNGGFINIGAYGGTAEASKSYFGEPVCESQIGGDINGDCLVDQADMDILQLHWLMEGTGLVNIPPTITLLSPTDGAELTYPTPIVFKSVASDPDGTVVRVKYTLEYRTADTRSTSSTTIADPTNNWDQEGRWSSVRYDGTYTMWAEAMDNEGAKTVSPKITVTLHPAK